MPSAWSCTKLAWQRLPEGNCQIPAETRPAYVNLGFDERDLGDLLEKSFGRTVRAAPHVELKGIQAEAKRV